MPAYDPAPRAPFLLGLNYPWKGYGWDFGPSPYGAGLVRRKRDEVERSLDALAASRITVLRWFLLSDGRNLPQPGNTVRSVARVRAYKGLGTFLERTASDADFERAIAPADEALEDLAALAAMTAARGMQLLPTFLSSTFLTPGEDEHVQEAYVARGRTSFLFGNEALPTASLLHGYVTGVADTREAIAETRPHVASFIEHALLPFVKAVPRAQIFAWDVMNEPEWCVRGTPYTKGHAGALLPPFLLLTYLNAALRAVAAQGHDVSIGFVDGDLSPWFPSTEKRPCFRDWLDATLRDYPGVTYFHQHHYYPRWPGLVDDASAPPRALPYVKEFGLGDRPVLLGEYQMRFAAGLARSAEAAANALRKKVACWPHATGEEDEATYLEKRLVLAKSRGYAGALGWAGPGDPANGQSCYADGEAAAARAFAQLAALSR